MDVEIRLATIDDVSSLLTLYKHLLSHDEPSPEMVTLKQTWDGFVRNPAMRCLLAEIQSIPIATCCLIIVPNLTRGGRPYALIENVVVHTQYQKMGVGRRLLEYAISIAREAHCYKVMLLSGVDNKNHGFYERLGFDRHKKVGFELRLLQTAV